MLCAIVPGAAALDNPSSESEREKEPAPKAKRRKTVSDIPSVSVGQRLRRNAGFV